MAKIEKIVVLLIGVIGLAILTFGMREYGRVTSGTWEEYPNWDFNVYGTNSVGMDDSRYYLSIRDINTENESSKARIDIAPHIAGFDNVEFLIIVPHTIKDIEVEHHPSHLDVSLSDSIENLVGDYSLFYISYTHTENEDDNLILITCQFTWENSIFKETYEKHVMFIPFGHNPIWPDELENKPNFTPIGFAEDQEISVELPSKTYLDFSCTAPNPTRIKEDQYSWELPYTSSIQLSLIYPEKRDQKEFTLFISGVLVAIGSSVAITAAISGLGSLREHVSLKQTSKKPGKTDRAGSKLRTSAGEGSAKNSNFELQQRIDKLERRVNARRKLDRLDITLLNASSIFGLVFSIFIGSMSLVMGNLAVFVLLPTVVIVWIMPIYVWFRVGALSEKRIEHVRAWIYFFTGVVFFIITSSLIFVNHFYGLPRDVLGTIVFSIPFGAGVVWWIYWANKRLTKKLFKCYGGRLTKISEKKVEQTGFTAFLSATLISASSGFIFLIHPLYQLYGILPNPEFLVGIIFFLAIGIGMLVFGIGSLALFERNIGGM